MNLQERNMLFRIHKALTCVPGANIGGGKKTTTVAGVVNYGADIQEVTKHCSGALEALFDGSLDKTERDEMFEQHMGAAEQFVNARKAEDWRNR